MKREPKNLSSEQVLKPRDSQSKPNRIRLYYWGLGLNLRDATSEADRMETELTEQHMARISLPAKILGY
uniref:Uncharacterized protein n=1 Tax=Gorilla gorilla gorilla TaxID=9595 RepID=A0A2I2ZJG0_GORGO